MGILIYLMCSLWITATYQRDINIYMCQGYGWLHYAGQCYNLQMTVKKSWEEAQTFCSNIGANLVSLTSRDEVDFLNEQGIENVWIGLYKTGTNETWKWVDKSDVNLKLWDVGQPGSIEEDCGVAYSFDKWHDYPCFHRKSFVCKKAARAISLILWKKYLSPAATNTRAVTTPRSELATTTKTSTATLPSPTTTTKTAIATLPRPTTTTKTSTATLPSPTTTTKTSIATLPNPTTTIKTSIATLRSPAYTSISQSECPGSDWLKYGGKCYNLQNSTKTWQEAQTFCSNFDANLVSLTSKDEIAFLNKQGIKYVWIGLHKSGTNDTWKWVDKSDVNLKLWDVGQPGSIGEDCGVAYSFDKWHDYPCFHRKSFVCKKAAVALPIIRWKTSLSPATTNTRALTEPRSELATATKTSTATLPSPMTTTKTSIATLPSPEYTSISQSECPGLDWLKYGGKCYNLQTSNKTWQEAQTFCSNFNANLVSLTSKDEIDFLNKQGIKYVWIGLHKSGTNDTWKWVDKSDVNLKLWDVGQPGSIGEECGVAYSFDKWHDYPCFHRKSFVCKKTATTNSIVRSTTSLSSATTNTRTLTTPRSELETITKTSFATLSSPTTTIKTTTATKPSTATTTKTSTSTKPSTATTTKTTTSILPSTATTIKSSTSTLPSTATTTKTSTSTLPSTATTIKSSTSTLPSTAATTKSSIASQQSPATNIMTSLTTLPRPATTNISTMTTPSIQAAADLCPSADWVYFAGSCYYFDATERTWRKSQNICSRFGANLVILDSQEEVDFLNSKGFSYLWIGLHKPKFSNRWQWVDKTAMKIVRWDFDQPGRTGEDCGVAYSFDKWHDYSCQAEKKMLCEKVVSAVPTEQIPGVDVGVPTGNDVAETTNNHLCPSTYWFYFAGSCYYKDENKRTWQESQGICSSFRADLVILNTQEEIDFLNRQGLSYVWIGLYLQTYNDSWVWVDKTAMNLTRWDVDEPGRSGEDCVVAHTFDNWHDYSCSTKMNFVCERVVSLDGPAADVDLGIPTGSDVVTTANDRNPYPVAGKVGLQDSSGFDSAVFTTPLILVLIFLLVAGFVWHYRKVRQLKRTIRKSEEQADFQRSDDHSQIELIFMD